MPLVDLCWNRAEADQNRLRLAVAADPYCGCSISAEALPEPAAPLTRVSIATTYTGSIVPLTSEKRTMSLEFHRRGVDGSFRSFYRTIPEIEPGPAWTQGVNLVYYDYLSEHGEGWFKDLQALADRIPQKHRGRVAVCLHGWYDYFQQYAYDHQRKQLLKEWTAFPSTYKVPMSLGNMHKRLKFAKGLGFRVLLYFSDGVNCDPGAPNFHPEYVLRNKAGKKLAGWKGPDTMKQSVAMDPGVPALGDWYRGYLAALLKEYAADLDGFVWDETFLVPTGFVSYTRTTPGYADRAMMSLVSELAQMVQQCRAEPGPGLPGVGLRPDQLCLGGPWHVSRQCVQAELVGAEHVRQLSELSVELQLVPVTGDRNNEIAATRFGLPQGLSERLGRQSRPAQHAAEVAGGGSSPLYEEHRERPGAREISELVGHVLRT